MLRRDSRTRQPGGACDQRVRQWRPDCLRHCRRWTASGRRQDHHRNLSAAVHHTGSPVSTETAPLAATAVEMIPENSRVARLRLRHPAAVQRPTSRRQALRMKRQIALGMILATSIGASAPDLPVSYRGPLQSPTFDGRLSVMTYNIHGLPWPVAWGRTSAFVQITQRLGALRAGGRQPHVVLLQEAFTRQAQAMWQTDRGLMGRGWANMSAAGCNYYPISPSSMCAEWPSRPLPVPAMTASPTKGR